MNKQPTRGVYETEPMALIPYTKITVEELYLFEEPICDSDLQAVVVPVQRGSNARKLVMLQQRKDIEIKKVF